MVTEIIAAVTLIISALSSLYAFEKTISLKDTVRTFKDWYTFYKNRKKARKTVKLNHVLGPIVIVIVGLLSASAIRFAEKYVHSYGPVKLDFFSKIEPIFTMGAIAVVVVSELIVYILSYMRDKANTRNDQ